MVVAVGPRGPWARDDIAARLKSGVARVAEWRQPPILAFARAVAKHTIGAGAFGRAQAPRGARQPIVPLLALVARQAGPIPFQVVNVAGTDASAVNTVAADTMASADGARATRAHVQAPLAEVAPCALVAGAAELGAAPVAADGVAKALAEEDVFPLDGLLAHAVLAVRRAPRGQREGRRRHRRRSGGNHTRRQREGQGHDRA